MPAPRSTAAAQRYPFAWIGAPSNQPDLGAWTAYLQGLRDNLSATWAGAKTAYATLKKVRESLGMPFIDDSPSVGEGGSAASHGAWTTDLDVQAQDIQAMCVFTIKALDEVLAGKRKLQWNQVQGRFEVEAVKEDLIRLEQQAPSGAPVLIDASTGQPTHVTGQVGVPALVWGATIVGSALALPVYFVVVAAAKSLTDVSEHKTMQTIAERQFECVQSGKCTPEQAAALGRAVYDGARGLREAKAKEEAAANKPTSDIADAVKTLGWVALGLAGVYMVMRLIPAGALGSLGGGGTKMLPAHGLAENPDYTRLRTGYLPSHLRDTPAFTPSGTDLEIWTWEEGDKIYGVAFAGKAGKPLWLYSFRNKEDRRKRIEETIASSLNRLQHKSEREEKKRTFKHTLKPGDVLYTSWGYDETHVDFYEVVEVRGKSVVVCPISKSTVSEGRGYDQVAPVPGDCRGEAMTKRVTESNSVKIEGHYAGLWHGKPVHETSFGWGH